MFTGDSATSAYWREMSGDLRALLGDVEMATTLAAKQDALNTLSATATMYRDRVEEMQDGVSTRRKKEESMSRLEEIKERIERGQELYPDDPKVLLERIEQLQRENERLKVVLKGEREGMPVLIERTETLKQENERLQKRGIELCKAVDRIPQPDFIDEPLERMMVLLYPGNLSNQSDTLT